MICKGILATQWNYKTQGEDWTDVTVQGGQCKSGKSQSPIDLKTPKFDKNLKGIHFFKFWQKQFFNQLSTFLNMILNFATCRTLKTCNYHSFFHQKCLLCLNHYLFYDLAGDNIKNVAPEFLKKTS